MLEIIKNKKGVAIAVIIIVFVVLKSGFNLINNNSEMTSEESFLQENLSKDEVNDKQNDSIIVVHITGAVKKPGVVKAPEGSRIEDIIELAGGLTETADITNVNLAFVLEDGVKIKIPSVNDEDKTEEYISTDSGKGVILADNESKGENSLVNINTANQTELENLTGIGPSIANKIIEYREKNGKFKNIEDIKNVSGIGENKFESIKNEIDV